MAGILIGESEEMFSRRRKRGISSEIFLLIVIRSFRQLRPLIGIFKMHFLCTRNSQIHKYIYSEFLSLTLGDEISIDISFNSVIVHVK